MIKNDENSWLNTPPSGVPTKSPTQTRPQLLPFEALHWQDFEKLCYRIVKLESGVEYCKTYGSQGSTQSGIDIFARTNSSSKYKVYQCKNEADFGPSKIESAVKEFLNGEWINKSEEFVLCTQESLSSTTARVDMLEVQAKILKEKGVKLISWDNQELSTKLKLYPELVDDFFGRNWVKAFCGDEVGTKLGERLDVQQLINLRSKLSALYKRIFNLHDRGIPLSDALTLTDRYIVPDVEDIKTTQGLNQKPENSNYSDDTNLTSGFDSKNNQPKSVVINYVHRISIQNWVVRNNKSLLFGDPGSGKSTFLRYFALDILDSNPTLSPVAEKWGSYVPLFIPFALWTKIISEGAGSDTSVKGVLTSYLKNWDEELVPLVGSAIKDKRLLLLIDGLDEHSNSDAARIALNHLQLFLESNEVAVVATTRRHGFDDLGMKIEGWQKGQIAEFSFDQQYKLAKIWIEANLKKINPEQEESICLQDVEKDAETFFSELSRSNELRELARNPLLLSLLISFQIQNIKLPLSRFEAYGALIGHLLSTHPRVRGVAAETPTRNDFSDDDLKKALAYLAYTIHKNHSEGLISEEDALKCLVEFLTDDQQGFGLALHPAVEMGRSILSKAEDNLGILVKKSQSEISFYHRTIQEYLTSFDISRLPVEKQLEIIDVHCVDPLWREVILGLFQINKRPDDIRHFIEKIQAKTLTPIETKIIDDLLSEVVFGNFNCPPNIARELSKEYFEKIEFGTWMPHREKLLAHALSGLTSSLTANLLQEKIKEWFPNRLGWSASYVFKALETWKLEDDVLQALLKGLNSEDYGVKIASAVTLAKIANGDLSIANKLISLIENSDDINTIAASSEGLMLGWQNHPYLRKIIDKIVTLPVPQLKIIGIKGKILLNIHEETDLDYLMKISNNDVRLRSDNHDIVNTIIKGWPQSKKVKDWALINSRRYGPDSIDRQIGLGVLLEGYPMDDDVAEYCVNEISHQEYPFNVGSRDAFSVLAKNFKDHPKLVPVLDEWVGKQKYRDVEVAQISLLGRTNVFKKHLIEGLESCFPHWSASALLQGWGIDDSDVSKSLREIVNGNAKKASDFGHLIPQIITDKVLAKQRLLEILRDPDCQRYDFIIDGLVALGETNGDTEVVDIALEILEKKEDNNFVDGLEADLIRNYSFDPRVKELAKKTLNKRGGDFASVVYGFSNDPELRASILKIINPLPVQLRQNIAVYLSDADIDEKFAISILKDYDLEKDAGVKVQSSIGYHTRLKNSDNSQSEDLAILTDSIVCGGPDHEERRLAAFCGLVILDRIDIMSSAKSKWDPVGKISVDAIRGLDINIPFAQFLLKNWVKIKDHFKDDFFSRVFQRDSPPYIWKNLVRFIDDYSIPKHEALKYYSEYTPRMGEAETLSFLSRTQPGSALLLDYCLNTLGLSHIDLVHNPHDSNLNLTYKDKFVAAEILGENFFGNKETLKKIASEENKKMAYDELVLALSEGWSDSEELKDIIGEMKAKRMRCWESTVIRIHCLQAGPITMYKVITRLIRSWASAPKYRIHEAFIRPIVRRLQKDDKLVSFLIRHISIIGTASDKISIARIIFNAQGLIPLLKKWAENELSIQLSRKVTESGFDITTGEFVSLPHLIYEILGAA